MKDCSGNNYQVFTKAKVLNASPVKNSDGSLNSSVFSLVLKADGEKKLKSAPGQFFLLKSCKTDTLLGRPISVYQNTDDKIEFLILKKGSGTQALCCLEQGLDVEVLGPLGNTFPEPKENSKPCIIGGGIGVAPVAGFASSLKEKSYDFYASFKSGAYGLEHIKPANLVISTDDGSVGTHGMLPVVFSAQVIKEKGYTQVYACGPTPMLAYIQSECAKAGVKSYLSMENRMACGMGACLGCTIVTTEGNRRCCKTVLFLKVKN